MLFSRMLSGKCRTMLECSRIIFAPLLADCRSYVFVPVFGWRFVAAMRPKNERGRNIDEEEKKRKS
jgi:hypothetical protein